MSLDKFLKWQVYKDPQQNRSASFLKLVAMHAFFFSYTEAMFKFIVQSH